MSTKPSAGTVCLVAVPADGPAPVGDATCVVVGGAIIAGGVCIAHCEAIGKAVGEVVGDAAGGIGDAAGGVGDAAEKTCSWVRLCSQGSKYRGDPRTAGQIIADEKKGSINQRFPGEWRDKTYDEIEKAAKNRVGRAQEAKKLLNDGRFKK